MRDAADLRAVRFVRILDALTDRLSGAQTAEEIARAVKLHAHETLDVQRVALAVPEPGTDELLLFDTLGLSKETHATYARFPITADLPLARVHRERSPLYFPSREHFAQSFPALAANLNAAEVIAGAVLPLVVSDRSLGALALGFNRTGAFDEAEQALLVAFARQTAVALERAELLRHARQETERVRYLAYAGEALATTLDVRATLGTLARVAVPTLADWAAVDLFREDGGIERVGVAHPDPEKVALVEELVRRYPPNLDDPNDGLARIRRTGEPEVVHEIPPQLLEMAARDPEHLHILRRLGLRSYIAVPIRGRDRVRGVFTLIGAESGRRYGPDDLHLATEIARRAAIALTAAEILDELRAARHALEEADRRKDEFIALLGHELRNPLAAISNAAQLFGALQPAEPRAEAAHRVLDRQVRHMKHLLDDLLDVARISRGKLFIRRDPIELGELLRHAAEDHRPAVDRAQLTLTLNLPPAPVRVIGDQTRIAQIVSNLLHNATKFTPAGGNVEVALATTDTHAILSVSDTGVGIEPNGLSQLFQPFVQAPTRPGGLPEGLGLGLALVRGLADLHGGTVTAHSEGRNQGTTFEVQLPLVSA